jgi:hypothetical protein
VWAAHLRDFATELFSIEAASELIRDKYFDGECVLLEDAIADLEMQTKAVHLMIDAFDSVAIEAGQPELVTDSAQFDKVIRERASRRAGYVIALAKSQMLDDFGEDEAADALLRPFILERQYEADIPGTT